MTPEERAKPLASLIQAAYKNEAFLFQVHDATVEAIREAESAARNAALEEAAKMVRDNDFNLIDPEALAAAIREKIK